MTAQVAEIWRHPIKSHGRESLSRVLLSEGRTMPWDRRWAVAHEMSNFDTDNPQWAPCQEFSRGSKAPKLQAITARCDLPYQKVILSHPKLKDLRIDPDDEADSHEFIQWVMPLCPGNRALPARLVRAPQRGMTDTDYPSISIINMSSHRAVAQKLGRDISHLRWRGNLILEGLAPWEEMEWVGKKLKIGLAEVEVVEPITRCLATTASTRTGERDADTLGALNDGWGHQLMGVYARVTRKGDVNQADTVELL